MRKICYLGVLLSGLGIGSLSAQETPRNGSLSGSFETNTIY